MKSFSPWLEDVLLSVIGVGLIVFSLFQIPFSKLGPDTQSAVFYLCMAVIGLGMITNANHEAAAKIREIDRKLKELFPYSDDLVEMEKEDSADVNRR